MRFAKRVRAFVSPGLFLAGLALTVGSSGCLTLSTAEGSGGDGGAAGSGGSLPVCDADYACVPGIPDGWSPVLMTVSTFPHAGENPSCPDESAPQTYFVGPATTIECGAACSCSYTGALCSAPSFTYNYNNVSCTNAGAIDIDSTDCKNITDPQWTGKPASSQVSSGPRVLDKGSCSGAPREMKGAPTWSDEVFLCPVLEEEGRACASGVCLPRAPESFEAWKTCIIKAGSNACPGGWTSAKIDAFAGGTDTRSCGSCACNVETVTCMGGSVTIFDGADCTTSDAGATKFSVVGECKGLNNYFDATGISYRGERGTPVAGACKQPTPQGEVVPEKPQTLCCR
jgi:hypothetical protein